ncbi:ATP-binding protein, partial [Streptococcus parasanguinis]
EKGILPVRFLVKDTGIGIAREDQERIFKAFEQVEETESRQMGTGLGLSISRSLTELMGGTLSVESCPGKGAAFSFTLPL